MLTHPLPLFQQSVDQNLELEVLKAEKEMTSENLQSEREQFLKELESVRSSLASLSKANSLLDSIIKNKTKFVDQQSQEIQTKSQNIETLSKKVRWHAFLLITNFVANQTRGRG